MIPNKYTVEISFSKNKAGVFHRKETDLFLEDAEALVLEHLPDLASSQSNIEKHNAERIVSKILISPGGDQ